MFTRSVLSDRWLCIWSCLAVAILTLTGETRTACAQAIAPPLSFMTGIADDIAQPGSYPALSMNFTKIEMLAAGQGRFQGELRFSNTAFPVTGYLTLTLENTMVSSYLSGAGDSGDGGHILFSGVTRMAADGTNIGALQYRISGGSQGTHQGYAGLVGMFGGQNWNHIGGAVVTGASGGIWRSSITGQLYTSQGSFNNIASTTAMTASLTVNGGSGADQINLAFKGSVSQSDALGRANMGSLGLDTSKGIIAVLIGLLMPAKDGSTGATIQGDYRVYSSLEGLYRDLVSGWNATFMDKGSATLFVSR
jgi:hypothetical protein